MEEKSIPYFVHEGAMARAERTIRRLWILCIILVLLLTATNGAWIYYEAQFTDETLTVTQDVDADDGDATINFVELLYDTGILDEAGEIDGDALDGVCEMMRHRFTDEDY